MKRTGTYLYITGGARSGKSSYALERAANAGRNITFIATAQALDQEMQDRIRRHRKERPRHWKTIEEPIDLVYALDSVPSNADAVIIDCVTLWVTNMLMMDATDTQVISRVQRTAKRIRRMNCTVIVVTNEVGGGIVPENKLARRFRDLVGTANRLLAAASDEAYACISGIPVRLK